MKVAARKTINIVSLLCEHDSRVGLAGSIARIRGVVVVGSAAQQSDAQSENEYSGQEDE